MAQGLPWAANPIPCRKILDDLSEISILYEKAALSITLVCFFPQNKFLDAPPK